MERAEALENAMPVASRKHEAMATVPREKTRSLGEAGRVPI